MSTRLIVLAAGLALAPLALAQQAGGDADHPLPITSLTLYRSGVGYFERRAEVDGDQKIQLRFATDQINDILKSMVVLDLNQGFVDAISYGSKEPLQRRLSSFGVDISDNPAAGEILSRLRGTPVRLITTEGEVSGTILNVENRPTIVGGTPQSAPARHDLPWINLVTPTGVRSVILTHVTGFEILDPALKEELNKALAAIAEHHADRVKTVDISLSGEGERGVVVAYVHEMPMWKTSYRLVLPEEGTATNGGRNDAARPRIQGWAIVENTTDEDWKNVRLSLVAGRPVSFQMDLYEPLHVFRPTLPVPMIAGVISRMYEQSAMPVTAVAGGRLEDDRAEVERVRRSAGEPSAPAAKSVALGRAMAGFESISADQMLQGVSASMAQGGDVGEVFQYTLENPVTVERQRSAMLPILSAPIDGRRVSIYSRADGSEHPMRGVELKNSTGLQLMPGPISVFDGPSYAGDAQISHVTAGDKRLLAYAVDLDVTAAARDESHNTVQSVRIVRGSLEVTTRQQASVTYTFTNKDAKRPRTILVEHPRMDGWDLVKPEKPAEETAALYRFEVALDAGKAGSVDVRQEHVDRTMHAVVGFNLNTILAYARDGKASQKVVDAVREAARLQAAHQQLLQAVARLDQERQAIDQDQSRIRQNMQSIAHDTELYRRYTTKLNEQETRLEAIASERTKAQAEADKAKEALDAYIRGLNVE